ncbi:hypothetical protein [Methyloversatilis sp.]|uniref:hypothetical protein n=2 Tax=Methyloversatilis sp. TaxID=2569862 RepID=UPI0027356A2F|nr:hypothetical protein [Methyloversatilis sp.]
MRHGFRFFDQPVTRPRATPATNQKEMHMKTPKRTFLANAIAAAVMAAALGTPTTAAQTTAHDHGAAMPHKLTLDHGRKWATDEPLRASMGRIRSLVEPQLGAAHADKLSPAHYRELAAQVESEIGAIVTNCKLEPKADAMLHLLIADLSAAADTMAGKNATTRPALGLEKVVEAVNQYGTHFDHPDFKPIRNVR